MCYFKDKLTFGYFNGIQDPENNHDSVSFITLLRKMKTILKMNVGWECLKSTFRI